MLLSFILSTAIVAVLFVSLVALELNGMGN
jgi:hypothetical protein